MSLGERDQGAPGAAPNPAHLRPGDVVGGRYAIEALLGEGGMGVVYAARHVKTHRALALKVLLPALAARGDLVRRFMGEARAAAGIGHPGIVEIVDLDQEGHVPFLVMERLEGEELSARIQRSHPLPPTFVARVGADIADALEAAHTHQPRIIHRDLKPQNVFLARRGRQPDVVKILDFGIAKLAEDETLERSLTRSGEIYGSPHYMSPEQLRNSKSVDERTDIYAIGVILYQALSGQTPFSSDSFPDLVIKITSEQPLPLGELRPDVPPGLIAVIDRAMARDRNDRFPTAAALREALLPYTMVAGVLDTLPATPVPPVRLAPGPAPVPVPAPAPSGRGPRVGGLIALLLLAGGAGYHFTRRSPPVGPPAVVVTPAVEAAPIVPAPPPPPEATAVEAAPPVAVPPPRPPRSTRGSRRGRPERTVTAPAAEPPSPAVQAAEHAERAARYRDLNRHARAIEEYERAHALEPDPELLYQIGKTHRLAGARAQALQRYRAFLKATSDPARRAAVAAEIEELEKAPTEPGKRPGLQAPADWGPKP